MTFVLNWSMNLSKCCLISLAFVLSTITVSCNDPNQGSQRRDTIETGGPDEQVAQAPVRGEVYITTKGRNVISLAGVDVFAVSDEALSEAFDVVLESDVADLHASYRQEFIEHAVKAKRATRMIERADTLLGEISKADNELGSSATSIETLQETRKELNELRKKLSDLKEYSETFVNRYAPSSPKTVGVEEFFDLTYALIYERALPIVRANSLGQFEFHVDEGSAFWLIANSERQVGDRTEEYRWLVPMTTSSSTHDLTNDNLEYFAYKLRNVIPSNFIHEEDDTELNNEVASELLEEAQTLKLLQDRLQEEKERRNWLENYGEASGPDVIHTPGKPAEIESIRDQVFTIRSYYGGSRNFSEFEGTRFFLFNNQGFSPSWGVITLKNYRTNATWKVYPTGVFARWHGEMDDFGFGSSSKPGELRLIRDLTMSEYLNDMEEHTRGSVFPICTGDPTVSLMLRFWLLERL